MYQNLTGSPQLPEPMYKPALPWQDWSAEVNPAAAPGTGSAAGTAGTAAPAAPADNVMPGFQNYVQPTPMGTESPSGGLQPARGLQMSSSLSQDAIEAPVNREEVYQGSLKGLLSQNVGHYIIATFLIGTQSPVSWEGILHSVGNDYLVIYQPDQRRYISGDFYSLKFVEFHDASGGQPACVGYRRRDGQQVW